MKHTQRISITRREWPYPHKDGDKPTIIRVSAVVEMELDLDSIAHALGGRAVYSKAKKSRALNGDVKVRLHSIEETHSEK